MRWCWSGGGRRGGGRRETETEKRKREEVEEESLGHDNTKREQGEGRKTKEREASEWGVVEEVKRKKGVDRLRQAEEGMMKETEERGEGVGEREGSG